MGKYVRINDLIADDYIGSLDLNKEYTTLTSNFLTGSTITDAGEYSSNSGYSASDIVDVSGYDGIRIVSSSDFSSISGRMRLIFFFSDGSVERTTVLANSEGIDLAVIKNIGLPIFMDDISVMYSKEVVRFALVLGRTTAGSGLAQLSDEQISSVSIEGFNFV